MLRYAPLLLVVLLVPLVATSVRVNPKVLESAQLACQRAKVAPATAAFRRCVERQVTGGKPTTGKPIIHVHPPTGGTTTGGTTTSGGGTTTPAPPGQTVTIPTATTPTTTVGGALGAAEQHCAGEQLNPGSPSYERCVQDQLGS